jgi:hypothetical protein
VVGAFSLKDTAALEKSLKAALKLAPKEAAELIMVDAFKVGEVNVHQFVLGDKIPPEPQKIFGASSVYLAFAPDAAFIAFGPQGEATMKEVLTQKAGPKPASLLQVDISGKRLMPLLKSAGVPIDGAAGPFVEKLAKIDRLSVLTIKLEGGDKLVFRQEVGLTPLLGLMPAKAKPAVPAPR